MSSEYSKAGIDYDVLDESKRAAIRNAEATSPLISLHGGRVIEESRGASAFVLELGGQQLAFVVEGLGTKSILARHWLEQTGEDRFADVAHRRRGGDRERRGERWRAAGRRERLLRHGRLRLARRQHLDPVAARGLAARLRARAGGVGRRRVAGAARPRLAQGRGDRRLLDRHDPARVGPAPRRRPPRRPGDRARRQLRPARERRHPRQIGREEASRRPAHRDARRHSRSAPRCSSPR